MAPFLQKMKIVLLLSADDAEYVKKMVESHKGSVMMDVSKRTTVVVVGSGVDLSDEGVKDAIENARASSVPIVDETWLVACINQKQALTDEYDHYESALAKKAVAAAAVAAAPEEEEEEAIKPTTAKKSASALAKAKASVVVEEAAADLDLAPPAAKKAKLQEDIEEEGATALSAPISVATTMDVDAHVVSTKSSSKVASVPSSSSAPSASSSSSSSSAPKRSQHKLKANTTWMGVCCSEDSYLPFVLRIGSIAIGAFEGTMTWPTLNGAVMKLRGVVIGDALQFTEYEIVKGHDEVVAGSEYTATLESDSLFKGSWELTSEGMAGIFSATLISDEVATNVLAPSDIPASSFSSSSSSAPASSSSSSSLLQPKSTYHGLCTTENDFELRVEKRDGNLVEGSVTWPALKYSTNFQGEISGAQFKFSETSILSSQPDAQIPVFPTLFSGLLDVNASSIKGARGDIGSSSSFTIKL